ncbi:MAG TPA: outer membrane beta-barrel protein [Chitinophagaceae bacterium]|nr:outer membrane beta-barrel protein [Chitinophagaceae bacterium]
MMKPLYATRCLLLCLLFFCCSVHAGAQSARRTLSGTVTDSASGQPIEGATVGYGTGAQPSSVSVLTQPDGSFRMDVPLAADGGLLVSSAGYRPARVPLAQEKGESGLLQLGRIALVRDTTVLSAVVVRAQRSAVRFEADKVTYDAEADPDSRSSTVLELMRKVPYLSVDGSGNILLNGSTQFRVLINGRPSGMVERDPVAILRNMPASSIKSIQVITAPSARYEAEGLAGIINIITHKRAAEGYNGTVNAGFRGPAGGPAAGGSFTFRRGKWTINSYAGGGLQQNPGVQGTNRRIALLGTGHMLVQQSESSEKGRQGYAGTEFSLEADSLNLVSAQVNTGRSRRSSRQALTTSSSEHPDPESRLQQGRNGGTSLDAGIHYQRGFRNSKDRLLTVFYQYSKEASHLFLQTDGTKRAGAYDADFHQRNSSGARKQTVQVDYVHPLNKGQLETGLFGAVSRGSSDFSYHAWNHTSGSFELDPAFSDDYGNRQQVLAVYQSYQRGFGKWMLRAGLRLEHTRLRARFSSGGTRIAQDYLTPVSSFLLSRALGGNGKLNLTYSGRIKRPSIQLLNPFVDRSNPDFESSGNPGLQPATMDVVQVAYNRSGKLNASVSLGAMLFHKMITPVTFLDTATGISRSRQENLGRGQVYKTNINLSYAPGKAWSLQFNSDIRHIAFSLPAGKEFRVQRGFNAYLNLNGSYRTAGGYRLQGSLAWSSGGLSGPQGRSNGLTNTVFTCSRAFLKEKLALSVSAANPFASFRYRRETLTDEQFIQTRNQQEYYRSFGLNLNYRFGQLKAAVKKSKRSLLSED